MTYKSRGKIHTKRTGKTKAGKAKRTGKTKAGKAKSRSIGEKISDAVDATKYVAEDMKRKATGQPSQREERDRSDKKVSNMKKLKEATSTKTYTKLIRPMEKK